MKRLACAAVVAVLLCGCGGPRTQLSTPASVCFRALPAAKQAAPGYSHLVRVRRTRAGCVVALRKDPRGPSTTVVGAHRFAVVTVDAKRLQVLSVQFVDTLPHAHRSLGSKVRTPAAP